MDKEELLKIIKEREFDYTSRIETYDLFRVILEWLHSGGCDIDFYIEGLVSAAGEGETNLYTSYYDTTIHQIILVDEVNWSYSLANAEELADLIEKFYGGIYRVHEKLLALKDNKHA